MDRTINPKYLSFYYATLKEIPEIKIDLSTTALLLIDLQKHFILEDEGECKAFKEAGDWERWIPYHERLRNTTIPACQKLLEVFRKNGLTVTYGRIASLLTDGSDRARIQSMPGWNDINIHVDSRGAEMVDELAPQKDEIVVNKTTDGVVAGTNYVQLLRNKGIKTVVVGGIVTDQCVACSVRGLADEGFQVITVEEACAAATMEQHDAELKIMNFIYCDVLSLKQTLELLEDNGAKL